MLLDRLGVSFLGTMLAGKGMRGQRFIQADEEKIRAEQNF